MPRCAHCIGSSPAPLVLAALLALLAAGTARATWVVALADSETGEVAIGQATCVSGIDLRALSAVIVTGRGVATVQAAVDSSGVSRATIRDELLAGTAPSEILDVLDATDPQFETHQYCIVDVAGNAATYTGAVAQANQFAGGQTGSAGSIRYCVAGNLLTGAPVVQLAAQAIGDTPGTLADKLMAAMQAAKAMGGDGRCSCSPGNPTGCGSPPPPFDRSAINGYLVLARTGDTPACASCSGGDYYLDLNVTGQTSSDPDPVRVAQALYNVFRANQVGLPDAVASIVTLDPPGLPADGASTSTTEILLLDLDGGPIGVPISSLTVEHAPESAAVSAIGLPLDNGGGSYGVTLTAGSLPGVDRLRVTADDAMRPVILMPAPRLPIGVPAEVANLRWSDRVTLEWDAAFGAVAYHVYRGDLASLDCGFLGDCRDDLDPDRTDLVLTDTDEPLSDAAFFYLLTGVDEAGFEGSLGASACGIRAPTAPCP